MGVLGHYISSFAFAKGSNILYKNSITEEQNDALIKILNCEAWKSYTLDELELTMKDNIVIHINKHNDYTYFLFTDDFYSSKFTVIDSFFSELSLFITSHKDVTNWYNFNVQLDKLHKKFF